MTNSRQYFTDDDLLRKLKEASLLEIGSALNSDLTQNWIALATRLGLENNEIENLRRLSNPGYEVLRLWKTRPNTTIRVLKNALNHMNRSDVIDLLFKAKTDPTDVNIVIRCDGEAHELTQSEVAGLTTLIEVVRPHIYSKFSQVLSKGVTSARLNVCHFSGSNRYWTSTVAEFRGQQIEIELLPAQRKQVTSGMEFSRRPQLHVERDCLSCLEESSLVFELGNCGKSSPLNRRSLSLSTCTSTASSNTEPVPRSPNPQSNDFLSSPVRQCSSPALQENFSELSGFHPEIPTDDTCRIKAAEVLQGNLKRNGAYILRRTIKENSVLALSVVYNKQVVHFSIMNGSTDGSCNYFFFNENKFLSVSELIAFYHHHSLSSENMAINTEGLFLTKPIP